jgi:hypothetical protein
MVKVFARQRGRVDMRNLSGLSAPGTTQAGKGRSTMNETFRILPLLTRMCSAVDGIFVEYVGPFGELLIGEARTAWLAAGNKTRSSDIESYIARLGSQIDDPGQRTQFIARARTAAGVAHLHPHG